MNFFFSGWSNATSFLFSGFVEWILEVFGAPSYDKNDQNKFLDYNFRTNRVM